MHCFSGRTGLFLISVCLLLSSGLKAQEKNLNKRLIDDQPLRPMTMTNPSLALVNALVALHPGDEDAYIEGGQGLGSFNQVVMNDLNSDGLPDLMYARQDMPAIEWIHFNPLTGYQNVNNNRTVLELFDGSISSVIESRLGDFDGDGFADLVYIVSHHNGDHTLRTRRWDVGMADFVDEQVFTMFDEPRELVVLQAQTSQGLPARFVVNHPVGDNPGFGFYSADGSMSFIPTDGAPVAAVSLMAGDPSFGMETGVLLFTAAPNESLMVDSFGNGARDVSNAFPELQAIPGADLTNAYLWPMASGGAAYDLFLDFVISDESAITATSVLYSGGGTGDVNAFAAVWHHSAPGLAQAMWRTPSDWDGDGANDLLYARHNAVTHAPEWFVTPFGTNATAAITGAGPGNAIIGIGGFLTPWFDLNLAKVDCYPKTKATADHKKAANKVINFIEDVCGNMAAGDLKSKCEKVVKGLKDAVNAPKCDKFYTPDLKGTKNGAAKIKTGELWIDQPLLAAKCSLSDPLFLRLLNVMYHEGVHLGCKEGSEVITTGHTIDFLEAILNALEEDGSPVPGGILDGVSFRTKDNPLCGGPDTRKQIKIRKWKEKGYQMKVKDWICLLARIFCHSGTGEFYQEVLEQANESNGSILSNPRPDGDHCVRFDMTFCGLRNSMKVKK